MYFDNLAGVICLCYLLINIIIRLGPIFLPDLLNKWNFPVSGAVYFEVQVEKELHDKNFPENKIIQLPQESKDSNNLDG